MCFTSIVVIAFVCIVIPWVMIIAGCTIYCEVNMKREIAFMSELLLHDTLNSDTMRAAFEKFAAMEHSLENVQCWKLMQEYSKCNSDKDRLEIAQHIVQGYLEGDSPKVNITEKLRTNVMRAVAQKQSEINMFDALRTELEHVMTDTHGRFKKTRRFKAAVRRSTIVRNMPPQN